MHVERRVAWVVAALAIGCGLCAAFIAIRYARQIPLDQYSFRQTQTALTAYWLQRDGFSLSYETPVVGPPWSIPFEFPIYQWIVAMLSSWTGAPLAATGRLVSFAFLVGCLFPARTIAQRLALSPLVFPVFCALLLSSPTYVYWGRTFMIETAALFFCAVAIRWFVELLLGVGQRRAAILFAVFMTVGILQKATTGVPILAVLAAVFIVHRARVAGSTGARLRSRDVATALVCFGIPLAIGLAWTMHTDRVKLLNPFAATALTTTALRDWNLGTAAQRVSIELFRDVVWKEILARNCAGALGVAFLIGGLLVRSTVRELIGVSLALGVFPLFVFTNLHVEHSYYQCANVVFFLFAIAIVIGQVLPDRVAWRPIVPVTVALFVAANGSAFVTEYRWWLKQDFTFDNTKEVALATIIRRNVPVGHEFVAFDFAWTSSLAYLSERKGFTVADVFTGYEAMRRDPTRFMDRTRLDAFVACPAAPAHVAEMLAWSIADGRRWKVGTIADCYVAVPERSVAHGDSPTVEVDCGSLELSVAAVPGNDRIAVAELRVPRRSAEAWFVELADERLEMLDVGDAASDDRPVRYSRLVDADPTGRGSLRIDRLRAGRLERCRLPVVRVQSQAWGRPGFDVSQEADAGHAEHQ